MGNKIANRSTGISKDSQQNMSEIDVNDHDTEIPNERYISPEERHKLYNNGIFYNNGVSKANKFVRPYTKSTNQI